MAPPIRIVVLFLCTLFLCQPSSSADQQEAPALVSRIAFGSCSNQTDPQPIWDAVIDFDPQVFIWLGDNIYGDNRRPWRILGKERTLGPWKNVGRFYPSSKEEMRSRYNQAKSNPGYTRLRLRRKTQVIGTWDDHDYGLNDAGKEFSGKVTNQKLMLDFLDEPQDSPRRKQAGVYTSYLFGPKGRQVKVILLDTRYHRDPLKSDGSILGDSQWQWLEKELTGTPSEITVIGSSIQVLPNMTAVGSPLLSAESWSRFPKEKARLFKLISDSKRSGVVFISGDVHFGEITRFDCGTSYPLYDVTSSGLTQSVEGEIPLSVVVAPLVRLAVWWIPSTMRVYGKNCRFSSCFYGRPNFGAIEIDWDATPVTLMIEVRDVHGHPVSQVKVLLSELQPGNMHQVPAKSGEYKHHCTLEVDLHWLVQYRFAFLLAGVLSVLILVLMLATLCLAAIAKRFCFPKAKHE